jgi:hypothetical protein
MIVVLGQTGQKVHKTSSQPVAVIPAIRESEIRRIAVQVSPGKACETLPHQKKMSTCAITPANAGSIDRRIMVQANPGQKLRPSPK